MVHIWSGMVWYGTMNVMVLCRGPGVAEKRQLAEHKVAVLRRALQHHPGCLRLQTLLLEALEAAERGDAIIQAYWQQVGLWLLLPCWNRLQGWIPG